MDALVSATYFISYQKDTVFKYPRDIFFQNLLGLTRQFLIRICSDQEKSEVQGVEELREELMEEPKLSIDKVISSIDEHISNGPKVTLLIPECYRASLEHYSQNTFRGQTDKKILIAEDGSICLDSFITSLKSAKLTLKANDFWRQIKGLQTKDNFAVKFGCPPEGDFITETNNSQGLVNNITDQQGNHFQLYNSNQPRGILRSIDGQSESHRYSTPTFLSNSWPQITFFNNDTPLWEITAPTYKLPNKLDDSQGSQDILVENIGESNTFIANYDTESIISNENSYGLQPVIPQKDRFHFELRESSRDSTVPLFGPIIDFSKDSSDLQRISSFSFSDSHSSLINTPLEISTGNIPYHDNVPPPYIEVKHFEQLASKSDDFQDSQDIVDNVQEIQDATMALGNIEELNTSALNAVVYDEVLTEKIVDKDTSDAVLVDLNNPDESIDLNDDDVRILISLETEEHSHDQVFAVDVEIMKEETVDDVLFENIKIFQEESNEEGEAIQNICIRNPKVKFTILKKKISKYIEQQHEEIQVRQDLKEELETVFIEKIVPEEEPQIAVREEPQIVTKEEPEIAVREEIEIVSKEEPQIVTKEEPEIEKELEIVSKEETQIVTKEEPQIVLKKELEIVSKEANRGAGISHQSTSQSTSQKTSQTAQQSVKEEKKNEDVIANSPSKTPSEEVKNRRWREKSSVDLEKEKSLIRHKAITWSLLIGAAMFITVVIGGAIMVFSSCC